MKAAIVHDYIKEYGGAERVLETLKEIFPDAPIYTTVYLPSFLGPHEQRFKEFKIYTSWAQYIPLKAKLISPLRIIAPILFRSFDFSGYDVVIVSQTGGYFPNTIKKGSAVQIAYCHTPPRYLYGFATARQWKKKAAFRVLGELMNHFLRLIDFKSSQNVDFFIANSENVKKRIKKFYRRDAVVIYPPVEIPNSKSQTKNKSQEDKYYLAGGRLARPKHIDLIVEAFSRNGFSLKLFGKAFAGYGDELIRNAGGNIEFLGEVSEEEKCNLMSRARAFVFASQDEDFGITPVEAMALGTPVIAYKSGGTLETVAEGKTGLFFDELSVGSLEKAVTEFNGMKFDRSFIEEYAQKFSKGRFKKEMKEFIEEHA